MPTKIFKKLSPVEGVVAGEKATCDFPIGPTVHKAIIEAIVKPAAGAIAKLSDICGLIKIDLDGATQREATADEINALNSLMGPEFVVEVDNLDNPGVALANGNKARFKFPVLFSEPFRKSYAADQVMAWPTLWPGGVKLFNTFQMSIQVPTTAGATLHAISVYAELENQLGELDAQGAPLFNIGKWRRETVTYTASGERHLMNLIKKHMYQSMHFFTQVGDPISHIKIKRENEEIIDVPKHINDLNLVHYGINEAALSDNRLDVIFDRTDLPDEGLPMNGVRQFEVVPTLSAAAAANKVITLITQLYGPKE